MRTRLAISGAAATALALVALLTTGLVTADAVTATPATPTEVTVIPPDPPQSTVADDIVFAGATGFLHRYNGSSQYLWTTYATGATTAVSGLTNVNASVIRGAGGDSVTIYSQTAGAVTVLDLATMASASYTAPSGATIDGVYGGYMLVSETLAGTRTLAVLSFGSDGSFTTTPVSGPAGATYEALAHNTVGDQTSAIVGFGAPSTGALYGILDLATGVVTPMPGSDAHAEVVLSAGSVAIYDTSASQVQVYSRSGVASGSDTAPDVVNLPTPAAGTSYRVTLAGQYVIALGEAAGAARADALALPLSGGAASTVLAEVATSAQGPTGAVVVGGSGAADWSVHEFSTAADGSLADTDLLQLTGPLSNAGLTISQGEVRHLEAEPTPGGAPQYLMFNHSLLPDNGFSQFSADPQLYGGPLADPVPCAAAAPCVRAVDSNGYGTSYLSHQTSTSVDVQEQTAANSSTTSISVPSSGGTLVDASPSYAIVDGTNPAAQYVVEPGYGKIVSTTAITGAALWFSTLWRADGPGKIQATSPDGGDAVPQTISTGVDCTATELQATERWLYWSCGASGPAGVYDLQAKTDIAVPAGPALLGDGFVVQHDQSDGDLVMYDVHTDAATGPVTLATSVPTGPAPDDRNITWAVDKYSGDVAYVAADDSVHVIDTGVPTTPPAIAGNMPAQLQYPLPLFFGQFGALNLNVPITRPVTGWQLTIRRASTGQVALTESGGPVKVGMAISWNGLLPSGARAYSGIYTSTLTMTTSDAATPTTVQSYPVQVRCGQIPFRSYDCDGASALLAVPRNTAAEWYEGTVTGRLSTIGHTENWPLCGDAAGNCVTAIVPFGDFNGDDYADILVRYRDGVLRAYLGSGQADFSTQSVKSIRISAGWNQYSALAAPGSLTSGGKPYLVARDTAGRLWSYATTGHGKFAARKLISRGWNQYTRLIGAGDLNGDGIGDLLAVDSHGRMWVYYGNGHGGFGARHLVSSGWNAYNAIIGVGDLNAKGNNDIVARGTKGALWLFPGSGRGTFGKPVNLKLNLGRDSLF